MTLRLARRSAAPRPIAWLAGVALACALPLGVAPPSAAADGGLVVIAQTRYQVLPAEHRIHVIIDAVATSREPDTPKGRVYYSGVTFAAPAGVSNVTAASGGRPIGVRIQSASDDFTAVEVTFDRRISYRQQYPYTVSFDLLDPGGTGTRDLRIGSSLVAFPVWAFGSQGEPGSSVRVELPSGYTPNIQGLSMASSPGPDGSVLLSAQPEDPLAFFAYVTAERPGAFANHFMALDLNGTRARFLIRAWDDDPAWDQQVTDLLRRGLPALQRLIGVAYPVSTRLSVEEAATSRLGEYAGLYNRVTGVIRVRYDADAFVTLHEAAHLWFNSELFEDRWIGEAWAEFYGVTAGRRIGASGAVLDLTDDLLGARIPLNDWGDIGVESPQVEDFAYAATYALAQRIADRAQLPGLSEVWRAAEAGETAYLPTHARAVVEPASADDVAGWQRLLDLLEERTGASYTDLWQDWVVDDPQQRLLAARQATRHEYAEAVAAAGDWELPASIREDLGDWQFDDARAGLADADAVLDERGQIQDAAAHLQLAPPATLRTMFEGEGGLQAALDEADAERDALALLTTASTQLDQPPSLVESIGLLGTDPGADLTAARDAFEAGELDDASAAATSASDAREAAEDAGRFRVVLAGGTVLALDMMVMGLLLGRRQRRRPGSPTATAVS